MTDPPAAAEPDPRLDLPIIGIVGAGIMGSGIAQLALEAGHEVVLHDVDEAAIERGRDRIRDGLGRRAAKSVADDVDQEAWVEERIGRLRESTVLEALADEADVVVEAAVESLELKRTIFRALDAAADPGTVLATNTSALSVATIAAVTRRPERVVGLHFFNPAPVMRLVEVVAGPATDPAVVTNASDLVASWGRTPVRSADSPGFIVNRVNRPYTVRALRFVERGGASIEDVDAALRDAGFRLGPFELMDLTGIDVTHAATIAIWEALGRPDRLRPSPVAEERVTAGHLGRKTGEGFHRYADGRRVETSRPRGTEAAAGPAAPDAIRDTILLAVVDEAHRVEAEGVATRSDIDVALRLGAAHPIGPFERAAELGGPAAVADRLTRLAQDDPSLAPSGALLAAAAAARREA